MEFLTFLWHIIVAPESFLAVVLRGIIWLIIALVIIINADNPDPKKSLTDLKSNLGFLLLFILLSGGLMFMLFGYVPAA